MSDKTKSPHLGHRGPIKDWPTIYVPSPRLENHVMIFHAGCGGIVTGELGKPLTCAECGQEMTAFIASAEEAKFG